MTVEADWPLNTSRSSSSEPLPTNLYFYTFNDLNSLNGVLQEMPIHHVAVIFALSMLFGVDGGTQKMTRDNITFFHKVIQDWIFCGSCALYMMDWIAPFYNRLQLMTKFGDPLLAKNWGSLHTKWPSFFSHF